MWKMFYQQYLLSLFAAASHPVLVLAQQLLIDFLFCFLCWLWKERQAQLTTAALSLLGFGVHPAQTVMYLSQAAFQLVLP